jgi:hypothetical protein
MFASFYASLLDLKDIMMKIGLVKLCPSTCPMGSPSWADHTFFGEKRVKYGHAHTFYGHAHRWADNLPIDG